MFVSAFPIVLLAVLSTPSAALVRRQRDVRLAVSANCGTFESDTPKDFNAGIGSLSSYKTIVAFGDAYTAGGAHDGGALPPAVVVPPDPMAGGRQSNGPVWVEYLAEKTGAKLLDYAVDGAIIDKYMWPADWGFQDASDFSSQFSAMFQQRPDLDPDTTLYVVFFGINDYEGALESGQNLTHQPGGLIYEILRLSSSPVFGRNFLVVDNYGRGTKTELGEAYKAQVFHGVQALHRIYNWNVAFADLSTIWDGVLGSEPGYAAFGYTNAGACTVNDSTTVGACADPDHSFYWIPGSPSTATHRIIADYVEEVLKKCTA